MTSHLILFPQDYILNVDFGSSTTCLFARVPLDTEHPYLIASTVKAVFGTNFPYGYSVVADAPV